MKKLQILLAILLLCSLSVSAQIIVNAANPLVVPSTFNIPAPNGIIVENGGVLTIENNGYLELGSDQFIIVRSGGRIIGQGGVITGLGLGTIWGGIFIETGVFGEAPAMRMEGDRIENATRAIKVDGNFSGIGVSRQLQLKEVIFEDNARHLELESSSLFHVNGSRFTGCQFLNATNAQFGGVFPIELYNANDVQFVSCLFDFSSEANLHLHDMRDFVVNACLFKFNVKGASLQGHMENVEVKNSVFREEGVIGQSMFDETTALELGQPGLTGLGILFDNVKASNNTIYPQEESFGRGIVARQDVLDGLTIINNKINGVIIDEQPSEGYYIGIYVFGASGEKSKITKNTVKGCQVGLQTGFPFGDPNLFHNYNLQVTCNTFDTNFKHWSNFSPIVTQSSTGTDPNNKFIGGSRDIENVAGINFVYFRFFGIPPATAPTNTTNVIFVTASSVVDCSSGRPGDDDIGLGLQIQENENTMSTSRAKEYSLFPNPVQDQLTIKSGTEQRIVAVNIFNSTGQQMTITSPRLDGNVIEVNLAKLPVGTYWCRLSLESGEKITKQFVIQR